MRGVQAEHLEEAARDQVAVDALGRVRPQSGGPSPGMWARAPENAGVRSRSPSNIGCDIGITVSLFTSDQPENGPGACSTTSRSGRSTGSARSITWSSRVKIAVLAPLPRASVRTTIAAKAGFFQKTRSATFRSWPSPLIPFSREAPVERRAVRQPGTWREPCQAVERPWRESAQSLGGRRWAPARSIANAAVPRSRRAFLAS